MKENIIKDVVEIRVSSLIELLSVPLAVQMQSIRYLEDQGYSQDEIHPNREHIDKYLDWAFNGYACEEFGTSLGIDGLNISDLLWAKEYLQLYYVNKKNADVIKSDQPPSKTMERTALPDGSDRGFA